MGASKEKKGEDKVVKLFKMVFKPSARVSLEDFEFTRHYVLLHSMDALRPKLRALHKPGKGKLQDWPAAEDHDVSLLATGGEGEDEFVTLSVSAVDADRSDELWVTAESFTRPSTLYVCENAKKLAHNGGAPQLGRELKQMPSFFNAEGIKCKQYWITSTDGTKVPYFLVGKGLLNPKPTLLYGYGGFEISFPPYYAAVTGLAWLEEGNYFALANIRGGGEFGPQWHQAALQGKRPRAYEDFEGCGKHLIEELKLTPKDGLYCMGGSNGGLLVGNMLARHTVAEGNLFSKVVCQCPLLDMLRFHKLLAGASWMAEYGNPEKEDEAEWLKTFSPYHLLKEGESYPSMLFTTSTKDDRVHPGHARRMALKLMEECKLPECWYYENTEGGHSCAADNRQRAFMKTLEFLFLLG